MNRGGVLLVRAGALGDVLLLRRAVAALRAAGWSPTLVAPRRSGAALVGPGASEVDALLDWERPDFAALHERDGSLPQPLQDMLGGFDLALVYSRSDTLAGQLRTVIPQVLAQDPAPPPGVHASHWHCRPLGQLGIAALDPPALCASAAEQASASAWLERLPPRFLAVHPGSGSPAKNWPAARFAALARELAGDQPWLLVQGPADAVAAASLHGERGAVPARELPPRVLGALLARAGLFVGNDSGATHLAAAFGAPTLALFGPTDPVHWAPLGPSVAVLRAPGAAMDQLAVEAVLEAAGRL